MAIITVILIFTIFVILIIYAHLMTISFDFNKSTNEAKLYDDLDFRHRLSSSMFKPNKTFYNLNPGAKAVKRLISGRKRVYNDGKNNTDDSNILHDYDDNESLMSFTSNESSSSSSLSYYNNNDKNNNNNNNGNGDDIIRLKNSNPHPSTMSAAIATTTTTSAAGNEYNNGRGDGNDKADTVDGINFDDYFEDAYI